MDSLTRPMSAGLSSDRLQWWQDGQNRWAWRLPRHRSLELALLHPPIKCRTRFSCPMRQSTMKPATSRRLPERSGLRKPAIPLGFGSGHDSTLPFDNVVARMRAAIGL